MFKKHLPGFTLIEMSFVLIIAGLIMGLSMPLLATLLQQQKHKQTQAHQEQILYALAAFLNQHGHLPAPAHPEAVASEHGVASDNTCQGEDHCQGLVPYRTLGLMENLAKDGYHHWMMYVTDKQLTQTTNRIQDLDAAPHERNVIFASKQAFCDVTPNPSSLQLLDLRGDSLLFPESEDLWAVILIGYKSQHRSRNAADSATFRVGGKSTLIKAVTRNNILAIYAHHPCQPQIQPHSQDLPSYLPSPDPEDWQRPLPRQPLRERVSYDER